ncbi:MAG: crotonase/enoyl-CoA hydratase family protein [Actinomycetota bacterium]|nr:crotonase/enoyl-CoA hydratase family protein [Actinomycetota bacterium]
MAVITHRITDHIFGIKIDRPEARNAVNGAVAAEMEAAIDEFESDQSAWVAILSGTGTNFSAGADLKEIAAGNVASLRTARGGFAGIVARKRVKPIIAAVHGSALAGGCEIAMACDLIVASRGAKFGLPEVKRSLVAAAGGLFRLPRVLPRNLATEVILTGDPISAERAHEFGMVNVLCDESELEEAATVLAMRIAANAPLAVREALAISNQAFSASEDHLFALSGDAMARLATTEDFQEGPRAFIEKRDPHWQGR